MAYMNERDAISGKSAKAFIIVGDTREELFYAKSLEATIEKNKVDVPVLGKASTPKRSAGWSGTGTLTIYYVSSKFRSMMQEYMTSGKDFWFDLVVSNEDSNSTAGEQRVVLKECNLDSVIAARFDASSDDMLEEEMPFTFNGYEIQSEFNAI
ncbi:phage tail tube protein [Paenibacillus yanchengensis]|uniref:Phage tail tube protein n=1 Tax=Paenibacillus yanchengensis TaxID=2035833 RepID=A0ABW4YP63_9BACL